MTQTNTQNPVTNTSIISSQHVQNILSLFKEQRISLRYTQVDVAKQLSIMTGETYHQTFISKMECNKLEFDTMIMLIPILQKWLANTTEPKLSGVRLCKKRKKPTRFNEKTVLFLRNVYEQTPKPSDEQIHELSIKLNVQEEKIKAWFSNRKKSLKRKLSSDTHTEDSDHTSFPLFVLTNTNSLDSPWILDLADYNETNFQNIATQTEPLLSSNTSQFTEQEQINHHTDN